MASPPFSIAETVPADDAIVSAFPGTERTFRDVVESWLLLISNTAGYTRHPALTTAARDAETAWSVANSIYNTTLGKFQILTAADADVWLSIGPEFPSGTRMAFQQTSAPTGWTKVSDAAYNDAAFRSVTGSVTPTGGTVAFTTAFASQAVAGTISGTAITEAQMPAHTHFIANTDTNSTQLSASLKAALVGTFGGDDFRYQLAGTATAATIGLTSSAGSSATHDHTLSGTAINLAVKYVDFIVAQKD